MVFDLGGNFGLEDFVHKNFVKKKKLTQDFVSLFDRREVLNELFDREDINPAH